MKSAEEWTNELDQEAKQHGFYNECLHKVKKIQAEARKAALEEAAKEACEGCREGWPVEWFGEDPMHILPPERATPIERRVPYAQGTHSSCDAWWNQKLLAASPAPEEPS